MSARPWEQIHDDYVNGIEQDGKLVYPTAMDLEAKYQIPHGTIEGRMAREGWTKQRAENQRILREKRLAALSKKRAEQITAFDSSTLNIAQNLQYGIAQKIEEATVKEFDPALGRDVLRIRLTPTTALSLARALKEVQIVAHQAVGLAGTIVGNPGKEDAGEGQFIGMLKELDLEQLKDLAEAVSGGSTRGTSG